MSSAKGRHSLAAGLSHNTLSVARPRRTTRHSLENYASSLPVDAVDMPVDPTDTHIYDILTANPDDPLVVRYAPGTKDIVGASPPRLIAYITSSDFLDYELLSDFFLTFRSYLSPAELAGYLVARLRWSVEGSHDSGRIVRVRTFVALRHWILNYFIDDFLPDFSLRIAFCSMVNTLHRDLRKRSDQGGHDAKIITELKKCWRRTCGLFWDDPDPFQSNDPDIDITPGGRLGTRDSREEHFALPEPLPEVPMIPHKSHRSLSSKDTGKPTVTTMATTSKSHHGPQQSVVSAALSNDDINFVPISPTSDGSLQVLSCSFPMRPVHRAEGGSAVRLYPHPAPTGHRRNVSTNSASRGGGGGGGGGGAGHKRSGSFSDALRDTRPPQSPGKAPVETEQYPITLPVPGSLVRGILVQPDSPYFEVDYSHAPKAPPLQTELTTASAPTSPQDKSPSLANPGVKRLLGSVRRALSTRPEHSHAGRLGVRNDVDYQGAPNKIQKLPTGGQRRVVKQTRPQIRMDVLLSKVQQSFNLAVLAETGGQERPVPSVDGYDDASAHQQRDTLREPHLPFTKNDTSRLNSNFTTGSRSIVIVDDTGSAELYLMSGALPVSHKDGVHEQHTLPMSAPATTKNFGHIAAQSHTRNFSLNEVLASSDGPPLPHLRHDFYQNPGAMVNSGTSSIASGTRTLTDRGASITSSRTADTAMLRRFASFQSGMSRNTADHTYTSSLAPSSQDDPFYLERPPARQLRRRPAADLRAVNHATDTDSLPRPRSAEAYPGHSSMAGPVDSDSSAIGQSMLPQSAYSNVKPLAPRKHKSLSLVDTHSSQPNLRPSFQAEVAKLAALPDDDEEDGGIESTLLKLEGRYEKRPTPTGSERHNSTNGFDDSQGQLDIAKLHEALIATPEVHAQDRSQTPQSAVTEVQSKPDMTRSMQSEDSYSSVPLLERGLSANTLPLNITKKVDHLTNEPLVPVLSSPRAFVNSPGSVGSSIEHVSKTESLLNVPRNGTIPVGIVAHHSFLLNDDQDLSDGGDSGELVDDDDEASQGVRSFYDDIDDDYLPHPLRHPSTPALLIESANMANELNGITSAHKSGEVSSAPATSTEFSGVLPFSPPLPPKGSQRSMQARPLAASGTAQPVTHLPFILAYDAEFLAQQFTIVEKDALDEIDWKELIELRWKHSSPPVYDWVEYLRSQEPRGVDIVIARFNLMTKWALSEIVLCENLEERVQCVIQYIRIAAYARRIRNYATMYQITLALVSSDCTRLKRTWAQVPASERSIMKELEALVQPVRNFYNLRLEMETAQSDGGCIPFIGEYLMVNLLASMPS